MNGTHELDPERQPYYITTAIDYPNAAPHIGHALEKVAADVVARYHRLRGYDTYFSGGLDENSQHIVEAADAHKTDLVSWTRRMDEAFRLAWSKLDISYDSWIRTTSAQHFQAAQEVLRRAQERGDIYKATYAGWYCPNCNTFYSDDELVAGKCPIHLSLTPEWLEEENYFFALSRYSERLLTYIRDDQHIIYVWFDALTNYLTAAGFPSDAQKFAHYWPADVHVIGKDITRFHCLYWPAMLLSAGLPLPRQIAVHGFITLEGQRVSKTTGNSIDPVELVDEFGVDAVRYYLLRNLSFAADGDFSHAGLIQHYNNELANELGNLLNRVVTMVQRYRGGVIPAPGADGPREEGLKRVAIEARQRAADALERWEIGAALGSIWEFVRRTNQYIEQSEPWRLARQPDQAEHLDTVLATAAEATRLLALYLQPYIPASSERILTQLGLAPAGEGEWSVAGIWGSVGLEHVVAGPLLFPRIDVDKETKEGKDAAHRG